MNRSKLLGYTKKLINQREFFIIALVVVMYIVIGSIKSIFLSAGNQLALLIGIANMLILGVGITPLMICGCFDMSVASILALSGGLASLTALAGYPLLVCILVGVVAGGLMGAVNGFFVAYGNMPAFVVTLATMNMFRGILLAISKGVSIVGLPASYTAIGQNKILGIQMPIWIAAVIVIISMILLKKMRFFRQCFYIGGNEKAAKLSGINVKSTKLILYIFAGCLAGFAGVLMTARYGTCSTTTGEGMQLTVITAVVVGGVSMAGGSGSILGMVFGTIMMTGITNVINLFGANIYWQTFIEGVALFLAICLDQATKISKSREARREAETLLRLKN